MNTPRLAVGPAALALLVLVATHAPAVAQVAYQHLRLIAPAAPGGGWDQTARVMQQVLQEAGLVGTSSVENIPGAAGTIGLARFISAERGQGDVVLVSGLIMVAGIVTNASPVTLEEVTPIARLTGEYEVIVVPAASPIQSLQDLIDVFRDRPESISWGGGSAGGSDQILAGLFAEALGVSPRLVNYIAFAGGGEAMSAVLGGQVSVGINGLAEFLPQVEAGTVRALALSSGQRLPGLDIPTLREQGIDIEFENWRSLVAPPGISSDDLTRLEGTVAAMVRSDEWRAALAKYRWIDRYLARDEFDEFMDAEDARVRAVLTNLGLGSENDTPSATARIYPGFVLSGLLLFGVAALVGALRTRRQAERVPRPVEWRPMVLLLAIGVVLYLVFIERAGFVVASAALFWLTARAFDREHLARDAVIAIGVAAASYVLFVRVLNLTLPAGPLARWL
jgi:putative tricarboxylic transport membrane protein